MAEEDSKLQNAILGLSNGLSNEISARISANSDISAFTMSYADRRRHYEIYPMDAAP